MTTAVQAPVWNSQRYVHGRSPFLVYLELTRACDLACRHCRAQAVPTSDPNELTLREISTVLRQMQRFPRQPHVVLTGGDPLKRPDLFEILAEAKWLNQPVSITPSGTPLLTVEVLRRLRDVGVASIGLSLDGSTAVRHDRIRGVPGSFLQTTMALSWALAEGLPVQVNTLVCHETVDDLPAVARWLTKTEIMRWSLFFLIRTGRGAVMHGLKPRHTEEVLGWLLDIADDVSFDVKATEAHQIRRIALQRAKSYRSRSLLAQSPVARSFGIRDGNGIIFISHTGEVYPSGFLPLPVGSIRWQNIVDVYQQAPLLQALRSPDTFHGKCGRCTYREVCGGSRARAYATTGDPTASDTLCPYRPSPVAQ